jgi:hypothetical protein
VNIFHSLLDAQKKELLFRKNKIDQLQKLERISFGIVFTMGKKDVLEAKLRAATKKNGTQNMLEAKKVLGLRTQETKNFNLTQKERIIIDADIKRIDMIKKRLDKVLAALKKSKF